MIFLFGFLFFFFTSIYIGTTYLHEHLQDEKWGNKIGLPGTRNVIQKWSVAYLGGIDLTSLGPPAKRKGLETSPDPPVKRIDKIDSIKDTIDSINKDISSSIIKSTLTNKVSDTKVLKSDNVEIREKDEEVRNKPHIQSELIGSESKISV
eukprot:CAMPEP_0119052942 /NCGR_PEP_ID=MMETSP1177-20130426/74079_1 /TAXON_ID=2985 /ORGANISM="Ochromonas sp, Strain CCMP1899" /LENGTH=149 /DNA_ID=CAMNT_0007032691 /DNA_START=227 /DNA_END=676 /DNA_ORIENTATION=+